MRYALYYAPEPDDPLLEAGNAWLGRDPQTGTAITQPAFSLPAPIQAAHTQSARRYGFHATLKAPFSLRTDEIALRADLAKLAARLRPFTLPALAVTRLDGFIALCPTQPAPALRCLAARCVIALDAHRAPFSATDFARRSASLDPRGQLYLSRYGYPHIFERFQFHLTLSDAHAPDHLFTAAQRHFAASLSRPHCLTSLALFCETEPGAPLRLIHRERLGG